MAQHDYIIANQGFPATRSDINSVLSAISTNNSGTSAPTTQYAGQFWIDTTSSTWTMYIHDGADDIPFATIDTSANTVNFTDSALDVVTDTTPQLGGDLDLNSSDITGTGNINITGDITASGSLLLGTALAVAEGGTGLTSGFANGITMVDRWRLTTDKLLTSTSSTDLTSNLERNDTTGYGRIGTGMTESSGIFTFPSTGIYLIESNLNFVLNDSSKWILNEIKATLDNSSYTLQAYNYQFISKTNNSNTYAVSVLSALLDVTDISLVKVKFSQARFNGNVNVRGDTSEDTSFFTFTRLGDT